MKKFLTAMIIALLLTANSIPTYAKTNSVLTKRGGVNYTSLGKETYYNLKMDNVIKNMKRDDQYADWEYWIREDGCKMFGDYIIIATNLKVFPRGSIVETSLGTGIVCDTGSMKGTHIDIATNW